MISLLPQSALLDTLAHPLFLRPHSLNHGRPHPFTFRRRKSPFTTSMSKKLNRQNQSNNPPNEQRTLFPGGYKRPEIGVPNVVLQLNPNEVLARGGALDKIDEAVVESVGIVVLGDSVGSGGKLYEAARLLKSLIRDRAYLMIAERVDIASAVNASGVVLSDQGLPAIVARDMMMNSKPESVNLPLVARSVQTVDAALNASNFEGADFLMYGGGAAEGKHLEMSVNSVFETVKIPVFISGAFIQEASSVAETANLLRSGFSGFVISLEDLGLRNGRVLSQLLHTVSATKNRGSEEFQSFNKLKVGDVDDGFNGKAKVAGFVRLESREKELIEMERLVLLEAINVIREAAPLMKEVSLLTDALSQLDEPFLLAIVGEFNSGKSTVINALLGRRYLREGVVPTTNEIMFLRYAEFGFDEQPNCERHPDGQYICYLPAPILREMNIVDTPGTNVILKRQQSLTEEFVPRADLLLFVISADRPLTESEVAFLRYTQQWGKKVVFVLNKSDLYQNASELEEGISFIKENARKLLNSEHITLFPVSARSALDAKLLGPTDARKKFAKILSIDSHCGADGFDELEKFLYSFLDGSTSTGMERMRLKLETPIGIADQLLSACGTIVRKEINDARHDLAEVNEIVNSVREFKMKMQSESISWRRQTLALIDSTKARVVKLITSTLQLSNLDLVASYVFKGDKSATIPASVQNDIFGPALDDAQKLLVEYMLWLDSNSSRERSLYKESFKKIWPSFVYPPNQMHLETSEGLKKELSLQVIKAFSAMAASRLFEQEIREVFVGTFGGLGVAGLSASLLTSVLPTTLEDLLALGLCSTGGYFSILMFPARRQEMVHKVKKAAEAFARELEEAMEKDLLEMIENLETFVKFIGKPYEDAAQDRLDKLSGIRDTLSDVDRKLRTLQIEIQNIHVS